MKLLAQVALGIWLMVFGYFLYEGIITKPSEGDSLAYHVPIAENIVNGKIWEFYGFGNPYRLYFYPAMGETVLAVFITLGIPLNLFNVLGWVLLSGCVYCLTRRVGLNRQEAVIASVSMMMWPSVIRLILNQTVDIWLAIWFTASLWLWEKVDKNKNDWLGLGLFMGMLIGTKYSGPLFSGILLVVYYQQWWKALVKTRLLWTMMLIIGGWWYIRNWVITGNPIYPGSIWFWKGDPTFVLQDWSPWKTLILLKGGWQLWGKAIVSEYLIWPILFLIPLFYRSRLVVVGILCFVGYLFIPSWSVNIVSDVRYLFPAFIALTTAAWKFLKEKGTSEKLAILAILTAAIELTQLDFKPKLFVGALVIIIAGQKAKDFLKR